MVHTYIFLHRCTYICVFVQTCLYIRVFMDTYTHTPRIHTYVQSLPECDTPKWRQDLALGTSQGMGGVGNGARWR